ncbi:hypothetical protein F5Y02DRAFT_361234 [Annulohypoxylon stygium]|nr:hypothetical protein F5Y02DRAFT_361234 [Annulohypoxylon stygium]
MEPITSNISAIGNHGQGSQNLHTGQGNQHTILGGTQFNIQGPFIVDRGLEQFTSSDNKDRWNALSDKSHVSSINDIFSWLDSICDTSHIKRHDLAIAKRTPRTGQWLLRSTKFQGWKDEKGLCLWLDGISKLPPT